MNPLDLVGFDLVGFDAHGDHDGIRVWHSASGDAVGLHYFPTPPDIAADLEDLEDVRAFYRKTAAEAGLAIIEVEAPVIHGCRCVRMILKMPQQPTGMTYLGSLTLPFQDFSYVLKVGCVERGTTGMRDAIIANQCINEGTVSISSDGHIEGWMADPYDGSVRAPLMRNRSEAQEYDARFPEHPLSRARGVLNHVQATLTIDVDLRRSPSFAQSETRHDLRRWWRLDRS
jgi:hypothetical protein